MLNNAQIVAGALQAIVCNPIHDESRIKTFFSPSYQQRVDGKALDFQGFINHMAKLKQITHTINVSVVAIAEQHDEVLTHHIVDVEKNDGRAARVEVFAHFTVQNGFITRCEELTRPIAGNDEDKELGSVS